MKVHLEMRSLSGLLTPGLDCHQHHGGVQRELLNYTTMGRQQWDMWTSLSVSLALCKCVLAL
jgi:hypothetical protein